MKPQTLHLCALLQVTEFTGKRQRALTAGKADISTLSKSGIYFGRDLYTRTSLTKNDNLSSYTVGAVYLCALGGGGGVRHEEGHMSNV